MAASTAAGEDEIICYPEVIIIDDEEIVQVTRNEGRMQCLFTWSIKNFSCSQLECGDELYSPIFSADSSAKTRWYLSVFPNGQTAYEEYISIHLIRLSIENELSNSKLNCKLSIIDSDSEVWHSEKIEQIFGIMGRFEFNKFVKRERVIGDKAKVLPGDTLTICCHICAYGATHLNVTSPTSSEIQLPHYEQLKKLSDDLKTLLDNGNYSDITLKVGDDNIPAHKAILAARSSVFARLLHDSAQSKYLTIDNFEKSTIESLLLYIYTGMIDVASVNRSLELYEASEKYNIRDLKRSITPSKIFTRTEVINEKYTFTWHLKNFSSIDRSAGRIVYSENFHTGPTCRRWSLSLVFRSNQSENEYESIGIYLNKLWTTNEKKTVHVRFKISLLDKDEQPRHVSMMNKCYKHLTRYGFPNFIKRSTLLSEKNELLPADILTIRCDMKVADGTSVSTTERSYSSGNTNLLESSDFKSLSENLKELLLSKLNSDVTVCSSNKRFFVHKVILCARSPVFANFFECLTSNLNPYTIDISGIKPNVLELLFLFIYTGDVTGLSCEICPELFAAAHHYDIPNLETIVHNYVESNLRTSNALKVLPLCNSSNNEELKEVVQDFICSHADELILNSVWADFCNEHASLSSDILKKLSEVYRRYKRRRLV